jgi:hypothetical protein
MEVKRGFVKICEEDISFPILMKYKLISSLFSVS